MSELASPNWAGFVEEWRKGEHGALTLPMENVLYRYDRGQLTAPEAIARLEAIRKLTR